MSKEEDYPFELLGRFLTSHNYFVWCSRQHPEHLHGNLEVIVENYLNSAFNDLLKFKIQRYSDTEENSERAIFYGLRLIRILEDVQVSYSLRDEFSIIRIQFLRFEENVKRYLDLDLGVARSLNLKGANSEGLESSETLLSSSNLIDTKNNEIRDLIVRHLGHLSGLNRMHKVIMEDVDYKDLVTRVERLLISQERIVVPSRFRRLSGITNDSLCHSFFSLMRDYFRDKKIHDFIILFLLDNFEQLEHYEFLTIKKKFSRKPPIFPF